MSDEYAGMLQSFIHPYLFLIHGFIAKSTTSDIKSFPHCNGEGPQTSKSHATEALRTSCMRFLTGM